MWTVDGKYDLSLSGVLCTYHRHNHTVSLCNHGLAITLLHVVTMRLSAVCLVALPALLVSLQTNEATSHEAGN